MTFVPGYQTTVTLNSEEISAYGHVTSLNMQRNVMGLPLFGKAWGSALDGQSTGTFSASGTVSAEDLAALQTMFASSSIAFTIQVGEADSATDAGLYSGNCVVSNLRLDASADGKWEWAIDAMTDDAVTHAPAGSSS